MSGPYDPNQPAQPNQPPWQQPGQHGYAPTPPRKSWPARHKVLTAVLAVVGLFVVLGGIGAAIGGGSSGSGSKSLAGASSSARVTPVPPATQTSDAADGVQETTPPPPEVSASYTPSVKDFTLVFKTTSKQCFGEAGCNLEGKVDFKSIASRVPDDVSVEVTFEIRGPSDGAVTDTIEVEGGQYDPSEQFFQTRSSGTRLTVVVTGVEEV